jgi:1,2-diacylglycerol 3-beta-glucosyltransferase
MATRAAAAAVLAVTALVAWATITIPLAARILQVSVVASMLYVAYLAWRGSRAMHRALEAGNGVPDASPGPFVSLVLPARNEAAVIGEAVGAIVGQRYAAADGTPNFELVVVDDASTDATADVARRAADAFPRATVVRRDAPEGPRTKAAVLIHAGPMLRGEVIGVIDADTIVEPGFLQRVMRAWQRDPDAAAIQVARRPRNADRSWLTAAQAEEQLMDMASQCGRRATDGTAELRGNGMFVRRAALDSMGGWNRRALTEDLDLSTRLSAAGHHVALAPDAAVEEEAVETLPALWRQRLRWAEGSLRRLLEHGPGLLAGSQPLTRKADFLAFAAEFVLPPLFATTILASLLTIVLPGPADWTVPASLFAGYGLGVFLLAIGGLSAVGVRGPALIGRALRGALFLSHWLLVVPVALVRIAVGPEPTGFVQTPRFTGSAGT